MPNANHDAPSHSFCLPLFLLFSFVSFFCSPLSLSLSLYLFFFFSLSLYLYALYMLMFKFVFSLSPSLFFLLFAHFHMLDAISCVILLEQRD